MSVKIYNNVKQGSLLWHNLRKNYPMTSSHALTIATQGKRLKKIVNPWNIDNDNMFSNSHTERGHRLEPFARKMYERLTGQKVKEVGFVVNEEICKKAGSSPDGMVGEDGLIEIKAPNDKKYSDLLNNFEIDKKYYYQMQHQLLITERNWVDYINYNENNEYPMILVRVYPDRLVQEQLKVGMKIGETLIEKGNEI